ncbi:MAG: ABC transporter ATP-binding protein [Hyphomicrobiaceae bacterium]|nr:ABC transporter ATP-binding protein [Hyphomicrobiaceae bacterium]
MSSSKPLIHIEALAKRFPEPGGKGSLTVFENLWLSINPGEFVCIIGHSGCGKSTILNILAGLDQPSEGIVLVNEREIWGPSLDRAVIFQTHALMPWLTAARNIELGVASRHRDWSSARIREHARRYLSLVHLESAADKKPAQLSGGMRQRVGIARALAVEPRILLMDEPFSALDALTRGSLQDEVLAIRRATDQTIFMITHDIDEAMLLADKIVLMTNGPRARIAEVVENTLPSSRVRTELHKHPNYYPLRNHLLDFLVTRSRELADGAGAKIDPRSPPLVRPIAEERKDATPTHAPEQARPPSAARRSRPAASRRIVAGASNGRDSPEGHGEAAPARNRPTQLNPIRWR